MTSQFIAVVLVASAGTPAVEPTRPLLATHPLEISGATGRAAQEVAEDFFIELARQPVELVTTFEVEQALERRRCMAGEVSCLGALAAATGATYALHVSVEITEDTYRLRATVAARAGGPLRDDVTMMFPKDVTAPRSPQLRAAFLALLSKLALAEDRSKEPVAALPDAGTPVAARPRGGSSRFDKLAYVAGGLALISGGGAVFIAVENNSIASGVRLRSMDGHVRQDDLPAVRTVDRNTAIATGLGIGAGALAIAAVVLLALPDDSPVSAGAAAIPGGAQLVVSGSLP